jgi:hypothetical protein
MPSWRRRHGTGTSRPGSAENCSASSPPGSASIRGFLGKAHKKKQILDYLQLTSDLPREHCSNVAARA